MLHHQGGVKVQSLDVRFTGWKFLGKWRGGRNNGVEMLLPCLQWQQDVGEKSHHWRGPTPWERWVSVRAQRQGECSKKEEGTEDDSEDRSPENTIRASR